MESETLDLLAKSGDLDLKRQTIWGRSEKVKNGFIVSQNIDFSAVKTVANGDLDVDVYEAICECASNALGTIVEVGTANGASAAAAALGAPRGIRICTIDKVFVEEDIGHEAALARTFSALGVADRIEFFRGLSSEVAPKLSLDDGIGMLILDADGAIDRDFALFYDLVLPNSPIIIDDCDDKVRITPRDDGVFVDQKHRLTVGLISLFEQMGLIERRYMVNETWFGFKPATAPTYGTVPAEKVLDVYRELIFARGVPRSRIAATVSRWLRATSPGIHYRVKRMIKSKR